jgi:hypothetical protein
MAFQILHAPPSLAPRARHHPSINVRTPRSPPHNYATITAPPTAPRHPLPPRSHLSLLPTPPTVNPLHRHRNLYPLRRPCPRPDPRLHHRLPRTRRTRRRCPRHHRQSLPPWLIRADTVSSDHAADGPCVGGATGRRCRDGQEDPGAVRGEA